MNPRLTDDEFRELVALRNSCDLFEVELQAANGKYKRLLNKVMMVHDEMVKCLAEAEKCEEPYKHPKKAGILSATVKWAITEL